MELIDIVTRYVTLYKSGAHMVGPCPKCGGAADTTRFVVNLSKNFANCYSCGGNWDVIRFLREIEGLSCPDAHRRTGIRCAHSTCPVWDKCSAGRGADNLPRTASAPAPEMPSPSAANNYRAVSPDSPLDAWQKHAGEYVEICHKRLLDCPEQLDYLSGRGLPISAVKRYRLGWIPKIEFKTRSSWGLSDKPGENGKTVKALAFPQGILIPWITDGRVHRLRLRKTIVTGPKDPRYLWIDGSGNDIICLNHAAPAHIVIESDLDGLLLDHLAGDLVGAVPLGSCSTKPKASITDLLAASQRILVSLDYDHEQRSEKLHAPGARASVWWFKNYPDTAKRWPVPSGKDPGEAFAAGCDLREWVLKGLPVSLQLKAAKTHADNHVVNAPADSVIAYTGADVPASPPEPETDSNPLAAAVVTLRTAADGRAYHITDNRAEYARLVAAGEIVFDSTEIQLAIKSGATPEQAAYFLTTKQVFPGTRLETVTPYNADQESSRPQYRGKYTAQQETP